MMDRDDSASGLLSLLKSRAGALVLVIAAILAGIVGLRALTGTKAGGGEDVPEEDPAPNEVEIPAGAQENIGLALAQPKRVHLKKTVTVTGIVSPDQTHYAHLTLLGRGIIEKVYVSLGARVSSGQPLVSYDNIELGDIIGEYLSLLSGLDRLEAARRVAQKIAARADALLEVEAIAQQEYEVREAEHEQSVASLQSQKADLARVEEKLHRFGLTDEDIAALRSAPHESPHRTASHNLLRAPFQGVIVSYDISPGELVERDQRLFTLVDTSRVWVLADVYEIDIARVRAGEKCRVQVPSYPGHIFTGDVTYVSDFLDPASRTAKVRCVVKNEDGRLKLAMFATVAITVPLDREGWTIPIGALQEVGGETVVFVQDDATRFEKRTVVLGEQGDEWVEIKDGLQGGDKVVTEGSFYLKSMLLREQIGDES